jgi:hypothetical protein
VNEEVLAPATDPQPPRTDSWEALLATMRNRYPGASDGILFCILKLQGNPDLKLKDFRQEADLHGIKLGGRALHSAKVLLGLSEPAVRRRRREEPEEVEVAEADEPEELERGRSRLRRGRPRGEQAPFAQLLGDLQQAHEAVLQENARLRQAIEQALTLLDEVLEAD